MEKSVRFIDQLRAKIRKRGGDIDALRLQNESVKNELARILRESAHNADFIQTAESILEMLLHADQLIDVLRHDFTDFMLRADLDGPDHDFEDLMGKFKALEQDIFKTARMIEGMSMSLEQMKGGTVN